VTSSRRDAVRTPLALPTATKRTRTVAEHLAVRFPTLPTRLVSAVLRLPPRSRTRRAFLSHLVCRAWAASDRGDLELCLFGYDPDVEITWPESGSWAFPDLRGVYRGHDGFRSVWLTLHEPWQVEVRLEEMIDAGDRLLVVGQLTARGAGSGIDVNGPLVALFTFHAGRIFREQYFNDREDALAAAGRP
jgi:ketosteroid isomerase-like protein